ALVLAVVAAAPAAPAGEQVVLARDGMPRMALVAGSLREPVDELRRTLDRITGGEFRVIDAREGATGVYVGLASDFPWLKLPDTASLGPEGFLLRSDGPNLLLVAQGPRGVQLAVTTFLQ